MLLELRWGILVGMCDLEALFLAKGNFATFQQPIHRIMKKLLATLSFMFIAGVRTAI